MSKTLLNLNTQNLLLVLNKIKNLPEAEYQISEEERMAIIEEARPSIEQQAVEAARPSIEAAAIAAIPNANGVSF